MKYIKSINEFAAPAGGERLPGGRTQQLTEEEFMEKFRENCKNFSFENDQLYRVGPKTETKLGFFPGDVRRKSVISPDYKYQSFFKSIEDKDEYPVKRMNSLIGKSHNAKSVMYDDSDSGYIVIPFDNAPLIFGPGCDLGLCFSRKRPKKGDFIMVNYEKGFKVPDEELLKIGDKHQPGGGVIRKFLDEPFRGGDIYGHEFFTDYPCLLLHTTRLDWLKSNVGIG